MSKFTYDDIVRVSHDAPQVFRPGARAWVIGVTEAGLRVGSHFDAFPPGDIYLVEYEDGEAVDIHESQLELFPDQSA